MFLDMYPVNLPEVMMAQADKKFDPNGNLNHETAKKLMAQLPQALADWTRKLAK
ncbi:MAG TPA: hypothetical protein VMG82_12615 [Candidatus Sulfotelmatobacter sp.]|nr:hypothetical protein [Candidatus Sulfotelmatobacter sp.]